MGKRAGERRTGPKCIAIVGPSASGKTSLFEAILARTGAIAKQAKTGSGDTVGDHTPEARSHAMSVEASFAMTNFMDEKLTFVDCPGSVEFAHEADAILAASDLAVVVAEADEKKIPALQLIMRRLDKFAIPRMLFLNKIEKTEVGVRDTLKLLQPTSTTPLLLRQIPLRKDGIVVGSIDLALERAYIYQEHAPSEIADIPDDAKAREIEARFSMLEALADHDDQLMEQLLEEIEPARDAVFDDLAADLRQGAVTPVVIGAAEQGNGVLRLLKAIRHDAPDVAATCRRLGLEPGSDTVLQIMKSIHTSHGGKLSVARVLGRRNQGRRRSRNRQRSRKSVGPLHAAGTQSGEGSLRGGGRDRGARKARRLRHWRDADHGQGRIKPLLTPEPHSPYTRSPCSRKNARTR